MHHTAFFLFLLLLPSLTFAASPNQERADRFLKLANAGYQALYRVNSKAQWQAVTDVTPEHDAAAEATGKAYAAFNGNPAIITEARELLTHQKELNELTVRELKQLLLNAAEGPMTNPAYFAVEVAAYRKATDEMIEMLGVWIATLRPLYLHLDSCEIYKLAEKYDPPGRKIVPAH